MFKNKVKKILLKSLTFVALYSAAVTAIAFYRDGIAVRITLNDRWHEFVILLIVMIGFNFYFDNKFNKPTKNKFYKDL